jgi:peptide/nickel transport system permease protein
MLALIIVGAPNSFMVGVVAAAVGMTVGTLLGFTAGFVGGRTDDVIRLISDVTITIPALMVLIVIQSLLRQVELTTMALLIALFAWPSPTRLIRAQVLTMRESGYVQMAKLSGASTFSIMFREIMPNLIPYLFASFIGNATGAILAAVGLETLGLGPQRVPTLGGTIYDAISAAAILRNMWWWWGLPTLLLAFMFIGLLLINLGFDEIANPRLRQSSQ